MLFFALSFNICHALYVTLPLFAMPRRIDYAAALLI